MPIIALVMLIAIALVLVVALLAWYTGTRRFPPTELSPDSRARVSEARLDPGERPASLAAEQIEEVVRRSLAPYADLAALKLDFGAGPGGELQIWVNGHPYSRPDDIPDARIREAIQQAVSQINR